MKGLLIFLFLHFCFTNCPLMAQEINSLEQKSAEDVGEEYHTLNHLAGFAGGTAMLGKNVSYFTLGLDYLHKFSESSHWAVSAFTEVVFAKHPDWVFGLCVYLGLPHNFFVRTGPGIEIQRHEEIDPDCNCVHVKSQTKTLFRLGIGYSYHKNSLVVSPTIDIDFFRSETALVFGVNAGLLF